MSRKSLSLVIMVGILVMALSGQALALTIEPVTTHRAYRDANEFHFRLSLLSERQAVAIARQQLVNGGGATVESTRLVIFRSTVAWEVILSQEGKWGPTTHQIMVHFITGRVLQHEVTETKKPQEINRDEAIRIAKGQVARDVVVRVTTHQKNSRLWTVSMAQKGAPATERIYVVIREDDGKIVERGWIKDNRAQVVKTSPQEAVAIARRQVNYPARVSNVGLALDHNTLVWEVSLNRAGIGIPNADVVLINAFTGRVLSTKSAT